MSGEILKQTSAASRWPSKPGLYFDDAGARAAWRQAVHGRVSPDAAADILLRGLPSTPIAIVYGRGRHIELAVTCVRDPHIAPAALRQQIDADPALLDDQISHRNSISAKLAHDAVNTDFHFMLEANRAGVEDGIFYSLVMDTRPSLQGRGIGTQARQNQFALADAVGWRRNVLTATSPASYLAWLKMAYRPHDGALRRLQTLAADRNWKSHFELTKEQRALLSAFAASPRPDATIALARDTSAFLGRSLAYHLIDEGIFQSPAISKAMSFDLADARQRRFLAEYRPSAGGAVSAQTGRKPPEPQQS